MQARFSMQYCLATAAAQGALGVADFEGEAIHRAASRAVMPRVAMRGLEETEGAPPPSTSVTVRLRDGRVLTEARTERRGSPALPLSAAEQAGKFRDCAATVLAPAAIDAALDAIAALPQDGDARTLVRALQRAG
jgi:2-methylcitrate dehydratase PrpD